MNPKATNLFSGNLTAGNTTGKESFKATLRPYDSYGAMLFVTVTICVYALSILAFIIGNQRGNKAHDEDKQISRFLKSSKDIETDAARDHVLKFRAMLLANSVNTHNNRTPRNVYRHVTQSIVEMDELIEVSHSSPSSSSDAEDDDDDVLENMLPTDDNRLDNNKHLCIQIL